MADKSDKATIKSRNLRPGTLLRYLDLYLEAASLTYDDRIGDLVERIEREIIERDKRG